MALCSYSYAMTAGPVISDLENKDPARNWPQVKEYMLISFSYALTL